MQRAFVEQTLAPLMDAAGPSRPLYFVDGAHPPYTGHPAFGWIKRGTTREPKSNHGRVNVNGALSWPDRDVVKREAEKVTSAAMIELFDTLAARHPTASAINIVLDNASYHHSAAIKAYLARDDGRIRLTYLPPYAPNLNLIERLWWFFKKKTVWNEDQWTLADFKAAIDRFFNNVGAYRSELASLISGNFHFVGEPRGRGP